MLATLIQRYDKRNPFISRYSKTCVREPPSRLTLNSGWCGKSCLSYKGTCHVILLAKLHDMYLYKTTTFPHEPLRSISKVAVLHRFYCMESLNINWIFIWTVICTDGFSEFMHFRQHFYHFFLPFLPFKYCSIQNIVDNIRLLYTELFTPLFKAYTFPDLLYIRYIFFMFGLVLQKCPKCFKQHLQCQSKWGASTYVVGKLVFY